MSINKITKDLINTENKLIAAFIQANWFIFAESYLELADAGCNKLLARQCKDMYLLVPVIYNVKHALEITVKTFRRVIGGEDIKKSHDILRLFKDIKSILRGKLETKEKEEKVKEILDSLEDVVNKYHGLFPIRQYFNKRGNIFIEDFDNVLLKYPEKVQVNLIVNYAEVIKEMGLIDVEIVKNDIKEIQDLLRNFFELTKEVINTRLT